MTINQHAEYILDNTDMSLIVYHEDGSDDLELKVNCNYCDLMALIAQLLYDTHEESDIALDEIGKDLNTAMETVAALRGELDEERV
jgi:hypothetical protein